MNPQGSAVTAVRGILRSTPLSSVTAYCLNEHTRDVLEYVAADRRLSNVSFDFRPGGVEAAAVRGNQVKSSLLIVEFDYDVDKMLALINDIAANCSQETRAIVIGAANDAQLFRELIGCGVSDYLVAPVDQETLTNAIGNLLKASVAKHGRSVAFVGSKGGVGTSTITQNAAWFIAENLDKPTAILDTHYGYGSASLLFNTGTTVTLADLPTKANQIDELVVRKLMVPQSERLSLICAPTQFEDWRDPDPETIAAVIATAQSQVDCLLIDVPAYWNDTLRKVLRLADDVVIVTCPDLIGLRNTRMLADALRKLRAEMKDPLLIVNSVGDQKGGKISQDEFEKIAGIAPTVTVRFDSINFGHALLAGQPALKVKPQPQFLQSIKHICQKLDLCSEPGMIERLKLPKLWRRKNKEVAI